MGQYQIELLEFIPTNRIPLSISEYEYVTTILETPQEFSSKIEKIRYHHHSNVQAV